MIDSMLLLAQQQKKLKFSPTKIQPILEKIINQLQTKFTDKHISLQLEITNKPLNCNEDLMYELILNLLNNAFKYNKPAGKIFITYDGEKITVKDTGIGIPRDKISHVTQTFFKVDNSRSSDGFGLGLSIVKNIVELHHWQMEINSKYGEWTEVTIKLR
jgi:signal transduction histidine kinase